MQIWRTEIPLRLPRLALLEIVVRHVGILTPRSIEELHDLVVADYGEVSIRTLHRSLAMLARARVVKRVTDDGNDERRCFGGYLRAVDGEIALAIVTREDPPRPKKIGHLMVASGTGRDAEIVLSWWAALSWGDEQQEKSKPKKRKKSKRRRGHPEDGAAPTRADLQGGEGVIR